MRRHFLYIVRFSNPIEYCYPIEGLIQSLDTRNSYYLKDSLSSNNARFTESYALKFKRVADNGIFTYEHVNGGEKIWFKAGLIFHDFDKGNTIISTNGPTNPTKGITVITEDNANAKLEVHVYDDSGNIHTVNFNCLLNIEIFYDFVFEWSGKAVDYAHLTIRDDKEYIIFDGDSNNPVGGEWSGDSTTPLNIGIYEDDSDEFNCSMTITHFEIEINNIERAHLGLSVGNGLVIWNKTSGKALEVADGEWVTQPYIHRNLTEGFTHSYQKIFDGSKSDRVIFGEYDSFSISNTIITVRTQLIKPVDMADDDYQTVLFMHTDELSTVPGHETEYKYMLRLIVYGDGRVEVNRNSNDYFDTVLLDADTYTWTRGHNFRIRLLKDRLKVIVTQFAGDITKEIYYDSHSRDAVVNSNHNILGSEDEDGLNSANGIISYVKVDNQDTIPDPDFILYITADVFFNNINQLPILFKQLTNDTSGDEYQIPFDRGNPGYDVFGDPLSNPATPIGHNGAETCVRQPEIQELIDADTSNVWFDSGGVAKDVPFDDLPENIGDYAFGNKTSDINKNTFLLYNPPRTQEDINTILMCYADINGKDCVRNIDGKCSYNQDDEIIIET